MLRAIEAGLRDTKIKQAQFAIATDVHVGRLDVAMQDAAPVQRAGRTDQPRAVRNHIRNREMGGTVKLLLQRAAIVPGGQEIQRAALFGRDHLRKKTRHRAPRQPLFMGKGGAFLRVAAAAGLQSFQDQRALRAQVGDAIQQRAARIVQHAVDPVAVDGLAGLEAWRHRQRLQAGQRIAQILFRQRVNPQHHGAGIVAATRVKCGLDQCCRAGIRIGLVERQRAQMVAQILIAQRAPDAVGDQQQHIAQLQLAHAVIDRQPRIETDRAGQHMLHFGLVPDMVGGQPGQHAGA
ncbi:hypothetical protein IMCC9480_3692 [Oxalobacteraceae bacterium IMCC9480]|nr:hypothetical protein IMCC9480_3692 [Oxalobacteraceae bacterium IMCC9480]